MVMRIALAGKPLAGKTALARLLHEKYGYIHASTSNFIVSEYVKVLNDPWMVEAWPQGREITVQSIYEHKEDYREALQVMSDDLGFQDPEHSMRAIQSVLEYAGAWEHPSSPVVLEAVRGEVQASAARALGFTVLELWMDAETQQRRAGSAQAYAAIREAMASRPDIESGVASASIRITPIMELEDTAKLITILDEEGLSHGPTTQPFKPYSFADWRGN